ncbi:PAP-specific phosphatase HAL2-like [Tripterygium wilfordii]|uniref:3'(2'),5'-bisphosphate nucleotidase n=1 Tax=Tripterygium wilfordii TaxID=458696 RepID=A0A7J7C265_TRIWF|nr:PAP-specific phosphatase HAL2-like [Tripterygium wilfordii]XP_038689321.1 PAP-specific phosphatase HAL2-like [Tripterygium wilfordii]KAF5728015.1 PAP-specific phosphatase HAL2-like [Tripterygium wilfordii]
MEGEGKYARELDVAVRVVHMVCALCQRVQDGLVSASSGQVTSKDDDSPVTIADWSVQATVRWILSDIFGDHNVSIVAEEDVQALSKPDSTDLLAAVVNTVNECLAEAPRYGLPTPDTPLETFQILEAIEGCNSSGGPTGRHWVLDPIDGTLGFVRGDQYAVALALIEDGKVMIGVLGCPNYPMKKELLNYPYRCHLALSKLSQPDPDTWETGCIIYAMRGSGKAWMQPLIYGDMKLEWPNSAREIHVSGIVDPALATFCESVERTNTNHSLTAGVAHSMGLRKQPLRVYSMVKYAAIARGDAEIFMKFARSGYKEKIWDHAAGVVIVEEAGGVVTDAGGRSLDFSRGVYLEGLDRGIVACSGPILLEKLIGAVYASWDSSNL